MSAMIEIWDHLHGVRHVGTWTVERDVNGQRPALAWCGQLLTEDDEWCDLAHDLPECPRCEAASRRRSQGERMPDTRETPVAELAVALTRYYDCVQPSEAEVDAAAILALLPHWSANLREEADRAWAIVDAQEVEIDRLQAKLYTVT